MAKFIEIPIIVVDSDDETDYEALGIKEPEKEKEVIKALINVDNISRVNSVDGDGYKCVLFQFDEVNLPIYKTPLTYDAVKLMLLE